MPKPRLLGLFCLCSLFSQINAAETVLPEEKENPEEIVPWLTGSLLLPLAEVIPKGSFAYDTYLYNTLKTGEYTSDWGVDSKPVSYSLIPTEFLFYGFTDWFTVFAAPGFELNHTQGQTHAGIIDLVTELFFQVLPSNKYKEVPGILIGIGEIFPIGKFQKLNPRKLGTDQTGDGTFTTLFDLIFFKIFHLGGYQFIAPYLNLEYGVKASVHVKDFNFFGGGFGTDGRVEPGNTSVVLTGVEYAFTRNWAFALDILYIHENKSTFKGKVGVTETCEPATVGFPSSEQLSFAPAIEYNWSQNFGIVGGVWFTAAGRNSEQFTSIVISCSGYF
jgi:opacity protein-like surface antigen